MAEETGISKTSFPLLHVRTLICLFWWHYTAPVEIVLIEGWMLGFRPNDSCPSNVANINRLLCRYQRVFNSIHEYIWITCRELSYIYEWRYQAETVLTRHETDEFVSKFIPAYENFGRSCDQRKGLEIEVDESRNVVNVQLRSWWNAAQCNKLDNDLISSEFVWQRIFWPKRVNRQWLLKIDKRLHFSFRN